MSEETRNLADILDEWEEPEEEQGYEVRDLRLVGWYWIESAILEKYGKELGPYGIATYNALACRAGNESNKTSIGAEYIANHTGISEKQAYRMIDKLEDLGLIMVERRPGRTPRITLMLIEKNEKKVAKEARRKKR